MPPQIIPIVRVDAAADHPDRPRSAVGQRTGGERRMVVQFPYRGVYLPFRLVRDPFGKFMLVQIHGDKGFGYSNFLCNIIQCGFHFP